jgi:hypothetical protein
MPAHRVVDSPLALRALRKHEQHLSRQRVLRRVCAEPQRSRQQVRLTTTRRGLTKRALRRCHPPPLIRQRSHITGGTRTLPPDARPPHLGLHAAEHKALKVQQRAQPGVAHVLVNHRGKRALRVRVCVCVCVCVCARVHAVCAVCGRVMVRAWAGAALRPARAHAAGAHTRHTVSVRATSPVSASVGPKKRAAVSSTPGSERMAAAGNSAAPRCSGLIARSSCLHCAAAAGPPTRAIMLPYSAPSATTGKERPPGPYTTHCASVGGSNGSRCSRAGGATQ